MIPVHWAITGTGESSLAGLKSSLGANSQSPVYFLYEQVMGLPRAHYKVDGVTVDDYNKSDGFAWWNDFVSDGVIMDGYVSVAKFTGANTAAKVANYYAKYVYPNMRDHVAQVISGNPFAKWSDAPVTWAVLASTYTGLIVIDFEACQPWYNQSFIRAGDASNKMWNAYQTVLGITDGTTNQATVEANYNAYAQAMITTLLADLRTIFTNGACKISFFNSPVRGTQNQTSLTAEQTEMARSNDAASAGGWFYPLLDFLCPTSWVEDKPWLQGDLDDRTAAGLSNTSLSPYFDLVNKRKWFGKEVQRVSANNSNKPIYWFTVPTYDNSGKFGGNSVEPLGWKVARTLWDQTTSPHLIVWTPLSGDNTQYANTAAGLRTLLGEASTMALNDYPVNSLMPTSAVANRSLVDAAVARVEAGGFGQILCIGDSKNTYPGGLGPYQTATMNMYLAAIYGTPTVTPWVVMGSTYTNSGELGHISLGMRSTLTLTAGVISGGAVINTTAAFLQASGTSPAPYATAVPGWGWQGLTTNAAVNGGNDFAYLMAMERGEHLPSGAKGYGGYYFDFRSGASQTCKFEVFGCGATLGTYSAAEKTIQPCEAPYFRKVDNVDPWNAAMGVSAIGGTVSSATGFGSLGNCVPGIGTLASVTVSGNTKYPFINTYGTSGVLVYGAVRARHGTKAKKGMVYSTAGVGGESIATFFNPSTGLNLNSGACYKVLCDDCDSFFVMLDGWTNRIFGGATASQCGQDAVDAAAVILGSMSSAQRAKTVIMLCTNDQRLSTGGDSAKFDELNQLFAALADAGRQIANLYGCGTITINTTKMLEQTGFNTATVLGAGDAAEVDVTGATQWATATAYTKDQLVYTPGSSGFDFWKANVAHTSSATNMPGSLSASAGNTYWRPVRSNLREVTTTDTVHHSIEADRKRAMFIIGELRSGTRYQISGAGNAITSSILPSPKSRKLIPM